VLAEPRNVVMTSPGALSVRSLGIQVGAQWIVQDVSFDALPGDITAVIGPNGAGKTTLFEGVVGLRAVKAGSIAIDGRPLRAFPDFARTFAFLPDAGILPPEASVETLVDHAISRSARPIALRRLREALTIDPLLPKSAGILSRGENQRVALFCTLALGRPVVVLDEPFSTFDPIQLRGVLSIVREIAAESTAVLASIHQLSDAEKVADRFLILVDGKTLAFGDLSSLQSAAGAGTISLEDVFVALLERSSHAA
jgi:ABC-2 type transport system ATP-binding protein